MVCVYLATWTAVDPFTLETKLTLTDEKSEKGNIVVEVSGFCASSSRAWSLAIALYLLVLLIISAAIATQNYGIRQEFDESHYLAFMLYSHLMFMLIRTIAFIVSDKFSNPNTVSTFQSFLLSSDVFITIGIYFVPKFAKANKSRARPPLVRSAPMVRNRTIIRRDSLEETDPNSFSWPVKRYSITRSTENSNHSQNSNCLDNGAAHSALPELLDQSENGTTSCLHSERQNQMSKRVSWVMDNDASDPETLAGQATMADKNSSCKETDMQYYKDPEGEEEIEESDHLLEQYYAS